MAGLASAGRTGYGGSVRRDELRDHTDVDDHADEFDEGLRDDPAGQQGVVLLDWDDIRSHSIRNAARNEYL